MWEVRDIEFRSTKLDFRTSERGWYTSTAVLADGHSLINALDLVAFGDEVQVQVCEHCGHTSCAPGGWVSPRRFGTDLVLIPCFREMASEYRKRSAPGPGTFEYAPPRCIENNGPALFRGETLRQLGSRIPALSEVARWPALSAHEFTRLVQQHAPTRALGMFPDPPQLRREFVVAVDPGEQTEMVAALNELLDRAFASDAPVEPAVGQPISFFLDLPGFLEWIPLATNGTLPLLAFDRNRVVSFPD